jgi:TRAP-type C4-dicarboxylate transport system substrate-binding protein
LKVRVVGSAIFTDIFRALGADPVNMNWGDAVTAFQQGTVDGQENPAAILTTVKIYQYHDHGTFWNYLVDPLIIYWCKKEWDAFPEDIQQGVLKAAQEAARYEKALCRAGLDGSVSLDILKNEFQHTPKIEKPIAFLEGQGMVIVELTPDDRAAFQQAVKPVFDQWVGRLGPSLYQGALRDMEGLPSSP